MPPDRHFRIPDVVIHQTLDGEAVVINLDNGRYYSFNDTGSLVWNALAEGHPTDAITAALAPSSPAARAAIDRFVDELLEQGLIQPAPPATPATPPALANTTGDRPLEAPRMEIYTDMERLLPLDPLHEVDERGWPNRKGGAS